MINALHLIWIIPLSAWFGFAVAVLMVAASRDITDKHSKNNSNL